MTVAVCSETPTEFRRYTIAAGAVIPIGTLLQLSGDNTASATSGDTDEFAGIAWEESTATDEFTEIVAAINGIWDIKCTAAAVSYGDIVNVGGADTIVLADAAAIIAGSTVGKALEAGNDTVIRVAVGRMI